MGGQETSLWKIINHGVEDYAVAANSCEHKCQYSIPSALRMDSLGLMMMPLTHVKQSKH